MDELDQIMVKKFKVSCCRSYLSPKGRCYSCPEDDVLEACQDEEE